MIAYRGPTLITEPELRWPIVLLAAAITALLAMLTAGLYYVAMTQSVKSDMRPRLERALQPGVRERTVVVIPVRQRVLESGEAINTRILLERIDKDSDRAHLVLEVTAMRFDES